MPHCRLLDDPPAEGAWNMALDEALLESAAETGQAVWRFYAWSRPTLSLGYFQPLVERKRHAASQECDVVRRSTGGGAIVHDVELTYALAAPRRSLPMSDTATLYAIVHQSLIEAISASGVAASLYEAAMSARQPGESEPFLCFARRGTGDVVAGGAKIAGSAQRRRSDAVLQHGSVLLAKSAFAPELAGLEELAGRPVDAEELKKALLVRLAERFLWTFERGEITLVERRRAAGLATEKYGAAEWLDRRQAGAIRTGNL